MQSRCKVFVSVRVQNLSFRILKYVMRGNCLQYYCKDKIKSTISLG